MCLAGSRHEIKKPMLFLFCIYFQSMNKSIAHWVGHLERESFSMIQIIVSMLKKHTYASK